ncbi:PREDICTED: plexin-A4-like [Amphimedon queenslandica]|uniref:Sema domain-containing protein n=1 Tax=Amphimedon queenslandica TaxID=400682 RepID=A0AAN0JIR3_AMPQE|nr:PREDICTED: plexin-A4-like [Amphimedon queenslandica]|eukprot:XP_019856910.1 PREDICTED: plexin-A4-like [Amphimedon queenslandica]
MKATTLLLFLTLAIPPSLFFLVNSQSLISSSVSSTVTHIAVSANGVFVSTATQVYRFSSTLQQLGDPLGSIGGTVNGLACTIDGEWCVVCTDAGGVTCSVLDGSNLEAPANRTVTNSGTATSLVVFTAPGGDGNSFYTGSYVNARILYHQYGFAGSTQSRATNPVHQQTFSFNRVFVSGFFASGYAYYFVNDPPTSGVNRRLRIIRVCNDSAAADGFNNQYELTLGCDDKESFFNPTLLGVSVINEETLLIVIRTSSVDICSYSLSEINSLMDAAYQSCVVNGTGNKNIYWQSPVLCSAGSSQLSGSICSISDSRGSTPAPAVGVSSSFTPSPLFTNSTVLNELTAFLGLSIDGIDFNYFAFTLNNNNYTAKYHLVNGTSLAFVSEVTSISSVTSLSWSQGSEYVYGISGSNVIALKIEDCSSATSCSECVSLGDPLCGWCMIENKCSRRPFCQDNNKIRRYLTQGNSNSCFDTVSINPSTYVIDTQQQPHQVIMTFSPAPLPPMLQGEQYFCVFNGIKSPIEMSINGTIGSCSVQAIISQVTDIQLSTTFSIYSNRTSVYYYTSPDNFTFYNCPKATKCSVCTESKACGWCQLDFTCTGSKNLCTIGNWLTTQTDNRICPFLQPNQQTSDGRYTQPANVVTNTMLTTINTQFVLDLSYECVYGTVTRTATVNNDNTVTCNNNPVLTIEGGRGTQNVSLSIRQVYNGRKYTIETNATANLTVILYDCPTLARGCSSCLAQRIGTGFSCSWCNSNAQCRDISNCSDASPVISTGNCPLPIISDFNPKAGPPRGGTTIIIDGTNLGTQRSDIESIMIGTRNCIIDKYEPGARIKCTVVPDTRDKIDRNVTITIRVTRSNDSVTASSTTQYQFITPIIQSVSPTYGPFSGGTKIRVQGTNFDIGNKEMTKVIMRESSSRIKRNTCPNINCTIMSITNTEIYCVSGNINASDCMRNVVVSVNGALFSNTSISYQYRPDPTFNSTSTMNIIPAGGIQLVFTGANLNSVQSPTITITDSRLAPSSIESCVINDTDTMLICIAPNVSNVTDSSYYGTRIVYMLMLDGAESPNYMNADLRLTLQPNPIFTGIDVNSRSISVNDGQINNIFIAGMNIRSVSLSEITIMLGDDSCSIRTSSDTEINCIPPNKPSGTTLALRVRVGRNLVFPPNGYTGPEWTLVYTSTGTRSTSIGAIVGGSIAANVFIAVFLVAIPLITIIFILKKKLKEKKERNIPTVTDEVIPMSTNLVYQSNISQDFTRRQLNSTQNSSSSIRLYDEIQHVAGNQHEQELESDNDDNDANQNNERFFNQVNQEDYEENGRYMYIDSLVMDEDNL